MKDFFFGERYSFFDFIWISICAAVIQRSAEVIGIWGIIGL
jgi:hypothetical protein